MRLATMDHLPERLLRQTLWTEFDYQALWVRGFRVCLAQELEDADTCLAGQALAALDEDIEQVTASIPASALAYFKRVTIWLEHEQDRGLAELSRLAIAKVDG
jgi:hypothetical protein